MVVKNTKARYFSFIIYPESIPSDWQECLEKLGLAMAVSPLHDCDEKKDKATWDNNNDLIVNGKHYKKPHYHVLYIAKNPVTTESVRKKIKRALGVKAVSHIEIVDSVENTFKYLTHESKDAVAKNKHVYAKTDIVYLNDFDIDRYIVLDENQKRELKNLLLNIIRKEHLVNVIHLLDFIEVHGAEHGIQNMSDVNDVITANSGGFRLYFDANYQMGYRYNRKPKIDKETGEILDIEK
ncbi:replication protein [Leuconostoc mesenteroides]|uniref:Plasmid replication protein n=1 Tax=Leuconostoc mesenteroides subsp. cremoris ATCC 19254 TaxID=586220 RepID=C2KHC7_LEUMC|nr:replication protein [Leuconostoc mesenteroides]EEJ43335.1 plasmid replication protein [Leuconostoc mesenteroides subsp. cremoris ATCC 19254]MDG9749825.1 replication protein [Leuconostoc mesenteroides]GEP16821.1 replication protein [Leuconostoc mesenteroides subsp. cremoris]